MKILLVIFLTVNGCIFLTGVLHNNAIAEEPLPYDFLLDRMLGDRKDDPIALTELALKHYNETPDLAIDAIYRLKQMEPEKTAIALPVLVQLIGVEIISRRPGSPNFDFYCADWAVLHCGQRATPFIVKELANETLSDRTKKHIEHLVDVLVKIEGREKAEQVLLEGIQERPYSTQGFKRLPKATALLRAREGLIPLCDKETSPEKLEAELARVKEETGRIELPEDEDDIVVPRDRKDSRPEFEAESEEAPVAPFPWYLIIIGAAVVAGGIAAFAIIRSRR